MSEWFSNNPSCDKIMEFKRTKCVFLLVNSMIMYEDMKALGVINYFCVISGVVLTSQTAANMRSPSQAGVQQLLSGLPPTASQ